MYEAEAKTVEGIQRDILAISKQEEPFDVFICYKETDANGRRTPDSVLATDLYYQLTKEGLKVFFSRITLEDKIGTAYEPYIFTALNSAKVMVVLGTKAEYFNAVWVKNEWNRYLALIRAGADKTLVPAYRDMDPYDLPDEFSHLQAQDMSKLGFMQDLITGIKKLTQSDTSRSSTKVEPQIAGGSNMVALLKRGRMALEDGEWQSADGYFDQVLNINAECAEAYLGKFLASKQSVTLEKYVEKMLAQSKSAETRRLEAVREDTERIRAAQERWNLPWGQKQIKLYDFDRSYISELESHQEQKRQILVAYDGEKLLRRARQFADAKIQTEMDEERKILNNELDARITQAKASDEKSIQRVKAAYAQHLDEADTGLSLQNKAADELTRQEREFEELNRERSYQIACMRQSTAKSIEEFRETAKLFNSLDDYKDSVVQNQVCEKRIKELKIKRKHTVATVLIAVIISCLITTEFIIPWVCYKTAEAMEGAGERAKAAAAKASNIPRLC